MNLKLVASLEAICARNYLQCWHLFATFSSIYTCYLQIYRFQC